MGIGTGMDCTKRLGRRKPVLDVLARNGSVVSATLVGRFKHCCSVLKKPKTTPLVIKQN